MYLDPVISSLAWQKIADSAKKDDESEEITLRPEYKKKSLGRRLLGGAARAVSTPLVGLSGAAAGGLGLGLTGLIAGGYLGHHHAPESQTYVPEIEGQEGQYGIRAHMNTPTQAFREGRLGFIEGRLPHMDRLVSDIAGNVGARTVNALGGPDKLQGLAAGAATGAGLGGVLGTIGGGLGGGYVGYRLAGGGKPPVLDRLVMEKRKPSDKR